MSEIDQGNVCDIQVMTQPPANPRHKAYSSALLADAAIATVKFKIWAPWDYVFIGKNMTAVASEVDVYMGNNQVPHGQVYFLKLLKEMVESMLRARNGQPAVEDEGKRTDPKEEAKDADHVLEVKRREEDFPQRMQTRNSQKGNHSQVVSAPRMQDDNLEMMKREDQTMLQ